MKTIAAVALPMLLLWTAAQPAIAQAASRAAVCTSDAAPELTVEPLPQGKQPEFVIDLTGRVSRNAGDDVVPWTVALFDASLQQRLDASAVAVSVQVFPSNDENPRLVTEVACGPMGAKNTPLLGRVLVLDPKRPSGDFDVWRLVVGLDPRQMPDTIHPKPVTLDADTKKRIDDAQKREDRVVPERALLSLAAAVSPVVAPLAAVKSFPSLGPDAGACSNAKATDVVQACQSYAAARDAKKHLDLLTGDAGVEAWNEVAAGDPVSDPGLDKALGLVRSVDDAVQHFLAAPSDATVAALKSPFQPLAGMSAADVTANETESTCVGAFDANVTLDPKTSPSWVLGTFELPSTGAKATLELPGANVALPAKPMSAGDITAWYRDAAPASKVTFIWVADDSGAKSSLIAALVPLLQVLAPALVHVAAAAPEKEQARKFVEQLTTLGRCRRLPKTPTAPPLLQDLALVESLARTSRMSPSGPLKAGRVYTVLACTDDTCTATSSSKNLLSQRQAKGPPTGSPTWSLVGAFTFDSKVANTTRPRNEPDLGPGDFGEWQWVPTDQVGTTQQIYELRDIAQPLERFTASLLLSVLVPTDDPHAWAWGVGLGPSIVGGGSNTALKQWTLNLLLQPPCLRSMSTYLDFGAGLRVISTPITYVDDNGVGSAVAVDRSSANPTPPALAYRSQLAFLVTVGIALDLSVLGDAAQSIFGVKGPTAAKTTGSSP